MNKRHIVFISLIVLGLLIAVISITYALTTTVSEGTSSDYDLSYTFNISDDTWTLTVPAGKTKVYEIALNNVYDKEIKYGVIYKVNDYDSTPSGVSVTTTKDSTSLPEDLISSDVSKTVSVMIENNTSSSITVTLGIVNGYKNGGDLIIPDGYSLVEEYNYALLTLTNLGLSVSEGTPDFSKTSCTDGCGESTVGIYKSEDDIGTSYYFRGDVENNYVYFAGFYWRIIRINGDGSIRMIYDGTSAHDNGESSTDRYMTTKAYNSSYNDNAYVGYMYGIAGSSTYDATHANTNSSTIKTYLDSWYKTNIYDAGYSSYVADAIYCNDREIDSGTGIGTTATYYKAYNRLYTNKTPTLECSGANDKFTVSSDLGNGVLEYPIGLITADEVAMAGGKIGTSNSNYYLYMGSWYWTMTPFNFSGSNNAYSFRVLDSGNLNNGFVGGNYGCRGVISLSSSAIQYGDGSKDNPWRITSEI